jgi:hypothetical protein
MRKTAMSRRGWKRTGLWLLVPVVLLAGCAAGEGYRDTSSTGAAIKDIPAALRDTSPSLYQWYSPPYFDPYEMP